MSGLMRVERSSAQSQAAGGRRLESETATFDNGEFMRAQQEDDYVMFKWSTLLPVRTLLDRALEDMLTMGKQADGYALFANGDSTTVPARELSPAIGHTDKDPLVVKVTVGDALLGWTASVSRDVEVGVPLHECTFAIHHARQSQLLGKLVLETATPEVGNSADKLIDQLERLARPYR
jgi:hypothetical protein